jgi:hypothetical protein
MIFVENYSFLGEVGLIAGPGRTSPSRTTLVSVGRGCDSIDATGHLGPVVR